MNHCLGCHGHVYDERDPLCCDEHNMDCEDEGHYKDCPGCQECERQEGIAKAARETGKRMCQALGISTDMDEGGLVKACEQLIWIHDGYKQDCERLRAELLSVRESLQRERAGQVKCNSGHISDRALWDCPVCVEAMRARLAKAERVVGAAGVRDWSATINALDQMDFTGAARDLEELSGAVAAWGEANG